MSVTPEQAAATMRRRADDQRAAACRRRDTIIAKLPEAKRILCDTYRVRRVVLFGSLARGEPRLDSDLDLAAWGLAPGQYFAALAELMGTLGCSVDLVRGEEASSSLAERIAAEGRVL